MQYVNDDMDELFRRAAENYPLDTSSGDWNKVAKALQDPEEIKSPQKGKGRFLWILLLLPLALICNPLSKIDRGDHRSGNISGLKHESVATKVADNNSPVPSGLNNSEKLKNNPEKFDGIPVDAVAKGRSKIKDLSINAAASMKPQEDFSNAAVKSGKKPAEKITGTDPERITQNNSGSSISKLEQGGTAIYRRSTGNYGHSINSVLLKNYTSHHFDPSPHDDIVKGFSEPELAAQKPFRRFYSGLMGGIDATTIRFQKWDQAGFNYGVLIGFSLNKKWSVEAGIYKEKKFYYTKARYFNTSKIYLSPNSSISEVSGNCTMFEIPLSLKYDFASARKSGWFSTLGISSYVMKKEDYTYQYYYGTTGPVPHRKIYNNTSTQLFSSVRLSGGYQHELGRIGSIRLEPYFSLPVTGMGFGKVKMISMGMHVGIVKKLW